MLRVLVCVVVLSLSLGCTTVINGEGFYSNFGQSRVSSCGPLPPEEEGSATPQEDCTVIEGAAISTPGAGLVIGAFTAASRLLGGASAALEPEQ